MVINHDFRFLAPICICTLGISKYLLIFGFVTFHILDIWKNLYLQIEKTYFQKPTLFVWWCFTEKCHALDKGNGKVKFFMAPPPKSGHRSLIFVGTSPFKHILVLVARNLRRPASEVIVQKWPPEHKRLQSTWGTF